MILTRAWVDEHCGDTTCIDGPLMHYEAETLAEGLVAEWERTGEPETPDVDDLADALYAYSHGMLA